MDEVMLLERRVSKKVLLAPSFKGPKKRKGIIEIDIDGFLNFSQSLKCGYIFTNLRMQSRY